MNWRKHPLAKLLLNKYLLATLFFTFWMVFVDTNNYFLHKELSDEIASLQRDISFYQKQLEVDQEQLRQLETDPVAFEKFVRENFGMVRPGETLTIVEFQDSIHE